MFLSLFCYRSHAHRDGPALLGRGSSQSRVLSDVFIWVALHCVKADLYNLCLMRSGLGGHLEKRISLILGSHCWLHLYLCLLREDLHIHPDPSPGGTRGLMPLSSYHLFKQHLSE